MTKRFRSVLSFFVAALMIGSISYLGVSTYKGSQAASGATIYANPTSSNVVSGSTLSVTIREDSGSAAVNSVQASMNYDSSKLQFVSIAEGGDFPTVAATSTNTPGVIRVARATPASAPISGDHPVVTVNFKVTGSGTADIRFDKAYSFIVRDSDNKDILENTGDASFAITAGSTTKPVATGKPYLYITPATGSFAPGSGVAVTVRLNGYDNDITTVQAALNYPVNQLQYVGVTEGGVFTTKQRTNGANGLVDIIRAVAGGGSGIQGDNTVVTVNFKAISNGGAADLSIAAASAVFDDSATGTNILNKAASAGASYTITAEGASAPVAPTPSPAPKTANGNADSPKTISVTTESQALTIGSTKGTGSVSLTTDEKGSAVTQLAGEVSLSPVIDPTLLASNPGDSIGKVEYYIDGKLISTQKATPFVYKFDSQTLRNGTYTMVVKTYLNSGTVDTRTDKLLVKNKVTLSYVARHYGVNIAGTTALLAVLVLLAWKLVLPRFNRPQPVTAANGGDHDALYGFGAGFGAPSAAGPVAGDPTVIAPSTASDEPVTVQLPAAMNEAVSAAQTTEPIPLAPAAPMPESAATAPLPTPSASAVITPTEIAPQPATPAPAPAPAARPIPINSPTEEPTLPPADAAPVDANTPGRSQGIAPPTNRFS